MAERRGSTGRRLAFRAVAATGCAIAAFCVAGAVKVTGAQGYFGLMNSWMPSAIMDSVASYSYVAAGNSELVLLNRNVIEVRSLTGVLENAFDASGATGRTPSYLAVAPDGDIYTDDYSGGQVLRFSPQGRLIGTLPVEGPLALAADRAGGVYVSTSNGLARFGADGQLQRTLSIESATSIAVARNGDLYVSGIASAPRISHFDASGRFKGAFGMVGRRLDQFDLPDPHGLAVDDRGLVWVTDRTRLLGLSPAGKVTRLCGLRFSSRRRSFIYGDSVASTSGAVFTAGARVATRLGNVGPPAPSCEPPEMTAKASRPVVTLPQSGLLAASSHVLIRLNMPATLTAVSRARGSARRTTWFAQAGLSRRSMRSLLGSRPLPKRYVVRIVASDRSGNTSRARVLQIRLTQHDAG